MRTARRIDAIPRTCSPRSTGRSPSARRRGSTSSRSASATPTCPPGLRGRGAGQGGRRPLDPPVPELLRAAVVPAGGRRLLPAPLRGRARPGHPGPAPDRLQGGDRPPAVGVRRPGRPGAGDRAGLPRVRGRDDPGRGRAGAHPAHRRGRLVPRLRRRRPGHGPRAKLLWLYPSNPTGAVATADQLQEAVRFAADRDLLLAYDNAYSRSPTTASSPRRSSRSRAPWTWRSSSARCPRSST